MTTKTHHLLPARYYPRSNQFTILVVDDMVVNRVLLSKVLTASGYAVIEADSGEKAVELLKNVDTVPDLIISDVEMPGMSGLAMTDEIRRLDGTASAIPIIIASGNPDERMELAAYEVGANAFLSKPFDLRELRAEVRASIKGRRLESGRNSRRRSPRRAVQVNELRTRLS